jgi:hypothetical protein
MRGDEILPGFVLAAPAERGEKPSQLILIRLSGLDVMRAPETESRVRTR